MSADAQPPLETSAPSSTSSPSTSTQFDPSWYTWSRFFACVSGTASDKEAQQYVQAKSIANEAEDCARCEKNRDWLFAYSPVVRFMRENIEKVGGILDEKNVVCRRCDFMRPQGAMAGGFSQDHGILLCANAFRDRGNQEDVMAHEMVHAYDYLRFDYDRRNLRHIACTEIRASMLSGECRWVREFFGRKQYTFTQHFQDCVRGRAIRSVKMHDQCKDDVQAVKTVNEVWESCFADTRPFDEIYR